MNLAAIVQELDAAGLLVSSPHGLPVISGITGDSRQAKQGMLFCAIEGTVENGHKYVEDAVERGAVAAVVTQAGDVGVPQIVVNDSRAAAAIAARAWYGRPSDRMTLIGVTGTNGKTTTVSLIRHLLNTGGTVASLGTLGAFDGKGDRLSSSVSLTTPGSIELQEILADVRDAGAMTVVMEASSHALDQRRLESVEFQAAVYTNLTHEHLDYHPDLRAYTEAKQKLSTLLADDGLEVVNAEDESWRSLPERQGARRLWYGRTTGADVSVRDEQFDANGARGIFRFGTEEVPVEIPLLGEYNVTNALAAATTAWGLGSSPSSIATRLANAPQIPGRMERLFTGSFTVLRDYAHTPDGYERAIAAVRAVTAGRLLFLFGCGGDRDRAKRSVMGQIATRGADLVIITSDNPRFEDPERIMDDIESGMEGAAHLRITDRRDAIRKAISMLEPTDCLLLAGKGAETYQHVRTEKHPFHEPDIVQQVIQEFGLE